MALTRSFLTLLACICFAAQGSGQVLSDKSHWTFEVKNSGADTYKLIFHVRLDSGWYLLSQQPGGEDYVFAPEFKFVSNTSFIRLGHVQEKGKLLRGKRPGHDGTLNYYENSVDFIQTVSTKGTSVSCTFRYQVCNSTSCLPPERHRFSFALK